MEAAGVAMFGWRKKRDGFEWHEYVRTTILLRRVNRRRRIDDMRDAAVDGLKGARRAAAAGLDNAKVAAAASLRDAADKGASAGTSGLRSLAAALASAARRSAAGAAAAFGALLRLPAGLWRKLPGGGAATSSGRNALAALGDRISSTGIGSASVALPVGAAGVALAIGAAARFAGHGFDATTILIALAAIVCLALVLLPALANADGRPRDQIIKDRGGRPSRSDYSPSDDISHSHPLLTRQTTGMLVWGGLAALAVLGLGPLLSPEDVGGSRKGGASDIVTSSIAPREAVSGTLDGHASALGGDTLRISGRIVRLAGIEAPESEQSCTREGGARWQCGEAAQRALERITRRDTLSCTVTEARTDGPSLATCRTSAGTDIAGELVRGGHAFADEGFFAAYSAQQEEARTGRKGIWSGAAQRPDEYRAARWDEASKAAPAGCPIKGQVSGRTRTYLLPWAPGYDRVKVRDTRGGRWFCSEDEARAAGWQPAQRS